MSIVELCSLAGLEHFANFELSKNSKPTEKYELTRETVHRLKEKNEFNCILSKPGRDGRGRQRLRLSYNVPVTRELNFSRNYISSIPFKILSPQLLKLNISHNIMFKMEGLMPKLPNLEVLNCSHNAIHEIPSLTPVLRILTTNDCRLSVISDLPNTLVKLLVHNNRLTELPGNLIQCNRLNELNYEGNPDINITEEQLEFIEAIFERRRQAEEATRAQQAVQNGAFGGKRVVYADSQNVHDIKIRDEVAEVIKKLMKDECEITEESALKEFGEVIGALTSLTNVFTRKKWKNGESINPKKRL